MVSSAERDAESPASGDGERADATRLTDADRLRVLVFGGGLLSLLYFSAPMNGLSIPVTFFLKNRLHLQANELAIFNLWTGAPLFVSFLFGFLRDRWSPFGRGDRGHLVVFGVTAALIYGALAFMRPTYFVLLVGLVLATVAFQVTWGAAAGLVSAIGQQHAMAGRMSTVVSLAMSLPALASYVLGGVLSDALEPRVAESATRILFLIAAALMLMVAAFGAFGPKRLFDAASRSRPTTSFVRDVARLVRHWPVYPVVLIQLLWQFSPSTGTVLQYHMSNSLHATDAEWGAWNALFFGSFAPVYLAYGFLCTRVRLSTLLWLGFAMAPFQMLPMLVVHTARAALLAAAPMGLLGGLGQAALTDLAIRSCPRGLQGTMMMLFIAMYYVAIRVGDLVGTNIYDHHGGFVPTLVAATGIYLLILPALLLVPKRLTATADGKVPLGGF